MADTRWTTAWAQRPPEEAALFNPAYCGELIARCATEYEGTRAAALPFALAFVVLPFTLHAATRCLLPGRANTTLVTWAADQGPHLADFPARVLSLRPVTRESILFAVQHAALTVDASGLRRGARPFRLQAKRPEATPDAEAARRSAALLGRWFGNQGSAGQVLQAVGLRP